MTNLGHKSSEFKEGYRAALNMVVVGDCPYNEHSGEHWDWLFGWATAKQKLYEIELRNKEKQP